MKKLVLLVVLMPFLIVAQQNESILLNLSEITVKPGHNAQFIQGVKAWKECYLENNGEDKWNMWKRVQGEGNVYTMTSVMANWAEMDEERGNFRKTFDEVNGKENWELFQDLGRNSFSNSWDEIWNYNAYMSGK